MEPINEERVSAWVDYNPCIFTIEEFYEDCLMMAEDCYHEVIDNYRNLALSDIDVGQFLCEFVWVVFASGFSTRALTSKFEELIACYSDIIFYGDLRIDFEYRWERVRFIINNREKHDAVRDLAEMLRKSYEVYRYNRYRMLTFTGWWEVFKKENLNDIDKLEKLPYIGPVTKYHLGRNIGLDCIKSDRHLVRLASMFGYNSPEEMCEYLSGLYNERLGVIDVVLFYGVGTWNTGGKNGDSI